MFRITAFLTALAFTGGPAAASYPHNQQTLKELLEALNAQGSQKAECAKGDRHCVPRYRFDTEVDEDSVNATIEFMDAAEKAGAEAIVLEINTRGGSVDDGFRLAKRIEESKAPVHCVVDGAAYSMGLYLLESCTTRMATRRSTLMAHQPALAGNVSGDSTRFENLAAMLRALASAMAKHIIRRMHVSYDTYMEHTAGGCQWWMDADQVLRYGAIDGVTASVPEYMASWHDKLKPPL